jgi:hypothetical protein
VPIIRIFPGRQLVSSNRKKYDQSTAGSNPATQAGRERGAARF